MKRFDLTDENDIKLLKKRISASFYKLTKGSEGVEDCIQEVITRMLEGRHQHATVDQAVIDYLRERRNFKGFRRSFKGEIYPVSNSYEQGSFDQFIGSDPRGDLGDRIDFNKLIGLSRPWERAVMTLFFREEYGQAEIGDLFGVSPSRVSQWLERIQKRICTRIAQEARRQEAQSRKMERILSKETERVGRGVEQNPFERMEIGKSFGLASFDEASF